MERQWLNLDQIKAEYASNDYNPELLLQHLLHHVESSPASVPEVTDGMAIAFHNALTDGAIGQAEVDEIKTGLRAALAAAPTSPVSEDRKDAQIERLEHLTTAIDDRCGKTIEKQSAALKLAREALFDMQDSYAAVHGWKDSFVIAATTAIAAIDSLQKGE